MKADTFYFQHDYEPTSDPKIQALIGEYGASGYGIYWRIVEMLHSNSEHKLPFKEYVYLAIAKQMLTSAEQIKAIIEHCINVCELFSTDGISLWSERVNRNLERRSEISDKRAIAGRAGAIAKQSLAKVSKGKESKGNKSKEKEINKENVEATASTIYHQFIDTYNSFILEKTGAPAKINGIAGKSANEIISYLTTACRNKDQNAGDDDVLKAWQYILSHHGKWEPFHQRQLNLNQISANLTNILNSIKNGNATNYRGKQPATNPADIGRLVRAGFGIVDIPEPATGNG